MRSKSVQKIGLQLFVMAGLVFSAYSFVLVSSFKTMDDEVSIIKNEQIHNFQHLPEIFTTSYFKEEAYYRPLPMLSYTVEYHFVKLHPLLYYLTNIFLHIVTAWLVFFLLLEILPAASLAFPAALLFAIHPVQWEAVTNISGRAILLCGLFSVLSLWLFILATRRKNRWLFAGSLSTFLLALLSKESAGMLPFVALAYQFLLSSKNNKKLFTKCLPLIPFFALEAIYIVFRFSLGITKVYHWRNVPEMILGFLSFLRGLLTYIRIMIFPIDLHFDRSRALFMSFNNPELWLTVLIFGGLLFALRRWQRKLSLLMKFFLIWALVDLLPVAQILASIGVQPGRISLAEHFLYTSSIGFLAFTVLIIEKWWKKNKMVFSPVILKIVVGGTFAFLLLTTVQNSIYSSNEIAMFERSLQFNPQNTRILNSLALAYAKVNQFSKAEYNFRRVLEIEPYNARARIGLGKALTDQGKFWEALAEYEKVQDPGDLKKILDGNRKAIYKILLVKYTLNIEEGTDKAVAYFSRGVIHSKMGNAELAIKDYEKSLELAPGQKDALFNLGSSYDFLEYWSQAAVYYQKVLDLNSQPNDLDTYARQRLTQMKEKNKK